MATLWRISLFFCLCAQGFCCNSGWSHYEGKCYKVSQNMYNSAMASRFCQISGGSLAYINSTDLLKFIPSVPNFGEINEYWVRQDSSIPESTSTTSTISSELAGENVSDSVTEHSHRTESLCPYAKLLKLDLEYCTEKKFFVCEAMYPDEPNFCPTGFDHYGSHCYRAISTVAANYEDAVKFCILQNSKLAMLETEDKEWEAKSALLGKNETYLVAARKYDGILKWNSEILFNPIHDLFGNYTEGDCVGFLSEPEHPLVFSWAHVDCNQKNSYLCEADPLPSTEAASTTSKATTPVPLTCPHGYNWKSHEESGYCFWETTYETGRLNWFQARDFCKLYGGDLASYSDAEQERIGLGGALGHYRGLWIGLQRDENDVFHWADGNTLSYTNWNYDEPKLKSKTKLCVAHTAGTSNWELDYCGVRRWFICKAPKVRVATMPDIPTPQKNLCDIKGVSIYRNSWYKFKDNCYLIQELNKYTWDTARFFCQDNGAHMASFHSFEETNFILSSISNYPDADFWIGLSAHGIESSYEWTDNTALDFIYWADDKSEAKDFNTCVTFNKRDGSWDVDNCNRLQGVICKRGINANYDFTSTEPTTVMPGNCEDGWFNLGNKCYKFFGSLWSQRLNWYLAKTECDNIGASLVSIHSQDEQDFLTDVILEVYTDVWIGLRTLERGTIFHWTDDSRMDYTNWNTNEPEFNNDVDLFSGPVDRCVEMEYAEHIIGKWNDINCSDKKGYICQKMKDPTNTMPYHDPFVCPNITGWYKLGSACYGIFEQQNMTWIKAQAECKKYGANLITYRNMAVSIFVKRKVHLKDAYFWTGIRETMPDKYECITGHPLFYSNWMAGQPQAASSLLDNCVSTTSSGKWVVKSCKEKLPFICKTHQENEPEPKVDRTHTCGNMTRDWYDFEGDYCYLYVMDIKTTWLEAMHYCFRHEGYLASFHSSEEVNKVVKNMPYDNKATSLHIGLGRKKDGSFAWVDRTPVDYTNWDFGQPDHNENECVEMDTNTGKWNDIDCEVAFRGFICSSPKLSIISSKEALALNTTSDKELISKKLTAGGIFGIVICIAVILVVIGMTVYYLKPTKQVQPKLLESDTL